MTKDQTFVDRALGLLVPLGPVRARAMFGGWGIYLDDTMFGLIADDALFLKVDGDSEERFAAAGAEPFVYSRAGESIAMSYRRAPEGALEDPGALLPWAELALTAARRARKGKSGKRKSARRLSR
ncbi:MAG TPA: TfoX/Sxy family protein [Kiloniellales bacterium]